MDTILVLEKKKMLKSFINYKTWEKVRISKWEHDKAKLEEELKMEIKWDVPFSDAPKANKKKDLDSKEDK